MNSEKNNEKSQSQSKSKGKDNQLCDLNSGNINFQKEKTLSTEASQEVFQHNDHVITAQVKQIKQFIQQPPTTQKTKEQTDLSERQIGKQNVQISSFQKQFLLLSSKSIIIQSKNKRKNKKQGSNRKQSDTYKLLEFKAMKQRHSLNRDIVSTTKNLINFDQQFFYELFRHYYEFKVNVQVLLNFFFYEHCEEFDQSVLRKYCQKKDPSIPASLIKQYFLNQSNVYAENARFPKPFGHWDFQYNAIKELIKLTQDTQPFKKIQHKINSDFTQLEMNIYFLKDTVDLILNNIITQKFNNHLMLFSFILNQIEQGHFDFQTKNILIYLIDKIKQALQENRLNLHIDDLSIISHLRMVFLEKSKQVIAKLVSDICLYNFVIGCYCYTHKQNIFSLIYLNGYQRNYTHSISKLQEKLNLFKLTVNNPNILYRIFMESIMANVKSDQSIRIYSNINSNKFSFRQLYQIYYEKTDSLQVDVLLKYITHFSQYTHEIVSELSQANNLSMEIVYNSIRFLLIFLVLSFMEKSIRRIQRQIYLDYGQITYKKFLEVREANLRWKQCQTKTIKAKQLSFDKVKIYLFRGLNILNVIQSTIKNYQMQKKQENQYKIKILRDIYNQCKEVHRKQGKSAYQLKEQGKSPNVEKILKQFIKNPQLFIFIFKLQQEYRQIHNKKERKQEPLQSQDIKKEPVNIMYQQNKRYVNESEDIMLLYKYIALYTAQQYLNQTIFQKSFKRLVKKMFGQTKNKWEYKDFLENKFLQFSQTNIQSQKLFRQKVGIFQRDYKVMIMECIKLFNMITTLPFYSYEVEVQNQRIRQIKDQTIKRKQPSKIQQILQILDFFYIYKAQRLNSQYLRNPNRRAEQVNEVLLRYIRFTLIVMKFLKMEELKKIIHKQTIILQKVLQTIQYKLIPQQGSEIGFDRRPIPTCFKEYETFLPYKKKVTEECIRFFPQKHSLSRQNSQTRTSDTAETSNLYLNHQKHLSNQYKKDLTKFVGRWLHKNRLGIFSQKESVGFAKISSFYFCSNIKNDALIRIMTPNFMQKQLDLKFYQKIKQKSQKQKQTASSKDSYLQSRAYDIRLLAKQASVNNEQKQPNYLEYTTSKIPEFSKDIFDVDKVNHHLSFQQKQFVSEKMFQIERMANAMISNQEQSMKNEKKY